MFTLSNLKKFTKDDWCYLSCDFAVTGIESPFAEKTMWVAVKPENADMLADNVYDPFVVVPVALGMFYKQDVHIDGNVSPKLYHNIQHYVMNILDRFSDCTSPIQFTVNGFDTVKPAGGLIGTGFSCGVDSCATVYDNFVNESDPNFRINSLFFFNCGNHGPFENATTIERFFSRVELARPGAEELGLPMYVVNSNYHAFAGEIGYARIGQLAVISCAHSLQRYIKRYYVASTLSYDQSAQLSERERDRNIATYSESYLYHLLSTENCEIVIDGCQYTRPEKTERISDWTIAQKYLNVCVSEKDGNGGNCSRCTKCARTIITLEAMGKLEQFKDVFDLDVWHKEAFRWKCWYVAQRKDAKPLALEAAKYARERGMSLPPRWLAIILSLN